MKSLLVYLCLLCFFSLNARAQFILQEDFQQGIPGTWALINNDSRIPDSATNFVTDAWVAISDSSDTTDIIAVSTSKYSPAGAADDWLITPLLSLGSNGILTWYARAFSSTAADGYQVRISTTTPTIAGFNALAPLFSTSEENTSWTKHSVDLAAAGYSNQTVYIAFRNNSNDKYLLALDDVTVFDCNSLNADAGVIDTSTTVSCAGAPALDLNLSPVYLSPAGGNTISGNTNDVPNWDPLPGRPFEDGGCCASASPPYQIVAFQVSESGNYDIVQVQTGYDGMMFIYTDPLDLTIQVPLNPGFAAGMTYVTGNDDGDSIGVSEILSLHLTQGETYYLISTGFDSTSFGDYTTTFTGPGIILIDNRNIADLPFDYNYVVSNSSDVIVSIGDDLTNETTFPGSVSGATFSVCGVSYVEANLDLSQYIGQTLASFTSDISSNNCADITPACHKAVIFSEGTADAGTADTVCAGNSVTLIASGGIAYSWSTGDTTASITVTPSTTTPYSVTVTNSLGCTATDVVTAFVYAADAGVFNSAPLSACSGDPRLLLTLNPEFSKNFSLSGNNTITGNTLKYFTWFPLDGRPFEDGACCTQNNSPYNINPFRVDVEGDYKITQHQQGYDGLIFLYTDPFDLTANPPVTFIDANDDSSGVVGVSAINSVFLNPSKTYYLVSTGLNAGNYGNYTTAFIGPGNVLLPVAPDSALFGFEYIIVDNTSTITSFGTDLSNVVSYPGSASGTSYQVCSVSYLEDSVDISNYLGSPLADLLNEDCLDVSDNCKVVTIFTNPSASIFTPNQTVCFTDTISISGNVPAVGTGQWTFFTGGGIIENIFLPTTRIYGLAAGMNTVAWTVNNGGCGDFDTMSIFVIKPPANAGMDDTVCRGGSVTLTASGGVSYSWNTGQTTASITFNAFITKSYTVTVTDGNGCSATDTVVVAVNLPPVVNIPDVTICP
ncbi:MAG TPA: choice-of-anchor J domain-containing protein, partial [Chitinophagales bacterium]|nr:choice-of-anchor J domain-containing protein [Chitinophagales bacterium]